MEYKDFIKRLYLRNHWYKANEYNEVVKISKGEFTKELFLNSVNNEREITDYRSSDESFKGYNKGNSIAVIAEDVLGNPDLEKLELFLKTSLEYVPETETRNNVVNRICENFKDVIDDITPENMCKKIAVFFLNKVLEPAVKNCGTDPDISHSENPESSEIQIPEQPLNEADEIENPNKNTKPDKTASDILSIEKPAPINGADSNQTERKFEFSHFYYCSSLVQYEKYTDLYVYYDDFVSNFISKQRKPCIDLSDPNNASTTLCEGKLYKLTTECSFTSEEKFGDTFAIVKFKYKDRVYMDYTSYSNWLSTSKLNMCLLFKYDKLTLLFDVKNADIGHIRIFIIGDCYDD